MKKILYVLTSLSHKRSFEKLVERPDCAQMVVGPKPIITQKLIPEDYSDFGIKNIGYYNGAKELQKIVDRFRPDVYVQASLPCAKGIKLPHNCKKVYVSHGVVGNHVKDIIKPANLNTAVWEGCDLYCGGGRVFGEWVKHVARANDSKILLNVVPQFDIISSPEYYKKFRDGVIKNSRNPAAEKVIMFAGFCCRDRYDFKFHNEDYFKTAVGLERIAAKNNWLVMIKPRQTHGKMMGFLSGQKWKDKYLKEYAGLQKSKYLHFITTTGHIYRYFFADAFVINGCSTIEVESCMIEKPLICVRTHPMASPDKYDPYDTIRCGAGKLVSDISKLEEKIFEAMADSATQEKQRRLISNMGLTIDGMMCKRLQDKVVGL